MIVHDSVAEPWRVTLVDTGGGAGTGGRLKRVAKYAAGEEAFCVTYCDRVEDIDIPALIAFRRAHDKKTAMTSVQPVVRFGALGLSGTEIYSFYEKPSEEGGWINGGFFVLSPDVLDEVQNDQQMFEREPIEALVARGEVHAFFHRGPWQAMDTLRDKQQLAELWNTRKTPWKSW